MRKLVRHISLFLFFLFVFLQVNNALHYYVVEHIHIKYDSGENLYPNYKNHDCNLSIFKITSILLFDADSVIHKRNIFYHDKKYFWVKFYYENLFLKNIFNKGPPV